MTTIRVPVATRDQLRRNAEGRFSTLGGYVSHLVEVDEHIERMAAFGRAVAQTPPQVMEEYLAEAAEWERAELADGLACQ